jgi:hypothetical protein
MAEEAEKALDGGKQLVRQRRRSAMNRLRPSTERQKDLLEWCQDNAPIKSGSLNESHLRYSTYGEAYKAYFEDFASSNRLTFSFSGFWHVLNSWAIDPMRYDRFACPLCYVLYSSHPTPEEVANDAHQIRQDKIWTIYQLQVAEMKAHTANFVLVIMDYSRVHELKNTAIDEGAKLSKFCILNFTVVLNGNKEHHFDYFACGKQGKAFMRECMEDFAAHLKCLAKDLDIMLWSDGGLKSYGTVFNCHQFAQDLQSTIVYRFFPSYHGHSRCDAHFGRGKRLLRQHFPNGGLTDAVQVVATFSSLESTVTKLLPKAFSKEEGRWSAWPSGFGVRSIDALRFNGRTISVQSVQQRGLSEWTQMPLPVWSSAEDKLLKVEVTPYLPVHSSIPDPWLHQESFQSDFLVASGNSTARSSASQPLFRDNSTGSNPRFKFQSFDPSRCVTLFYPHP